MAGGEKNLYGGGLLEFLFERFGALGTFAIFAGVTLALVLVARWLGRRKRR